jgi:hypothetical protein
VRLLAGALLGLVLAWPASALAFLPNDPLVQRQWYAFQDDAFDLWPGPDPPVLSSVLVAVVDSGIDGTHPEFLGRIAAARSFVGGSALVDQQGHGTFVAGEIAAALGNSQGIAGIAFPAQLLVAKIVRPDGSISLTAEAEAIHWAVDSGARVINLSLGGVRDPLDPTRDTFSQLEAEAVSYAVRHGAVVVAAVGNSDQAPSVPWNYASYPAALPHVIGVSALGRDGSSPSFSDRDAVYNDIAAPGEDILSTFPRALTALHPSCVDQGYSSCGSDDYRHAEGTSFAAPQVSAAAALLLAAKPNLTNDQVSYLLERSADDVNASNGCDQCPLQRDALTGWGRLDIEAALQAALSGPVPPPDGLEPNDDAGTQAWPVYGRSADIKATLDFWDDQIDVYRVYLAKRQFLSAVLKGPPSTDLNLLLWKPGTDRVEGLSLALLRNRLAESAKPGPFERIGFLAKAAGWYDVEVKVGTATPSPVAYGLTIAKSARQPLSGG